jgi:hypothetical protein
MSDELPSLADLSKMPIPDEHLAGLRAMEDTFRDRLLTSRFSYWNTLGSLHAVLLSAASIVASIRPDAPRWGFAIVALFCIVGIVAVARAFRLMTAFYDSQIFQPGTLKSLGSLAAHNEHFEKTAPQRAYQLKRQRKSLQRASEWCLFGALLGLSILVLA